MEIDRQSEFSWGRSNEWIFVLSTILFSGLIAQFPRIFDLNPEVFYPRNIALIIFPSLITYISWRNNLSTNYFILPIILIIVSTVFINFLPGDENNDVFILSCLHLPLFLWSIYGYAFMGENWKKSKDRINFLKYNGDFIVILTILLISCFLFSAITINLFALIEINIEDFYFQNIVSWGLPGIPILASFLVINNPSLTQKISPLIAKIFTPFVFITLFIFSLSIIATGKDIYGDRDLLLIFNVILITVMVLIFFSLGESIKVGSGKIQIFLLFLLSLITILDDLLALSAIGFRLFEFGITPNRIAVLVPNLLILFHLLIVSKQIIRVLKNKLKVNTIEEKIGKYLPIYTIWAAVVTFLFPFLFH